jgi:hypothetical protein
MDRIAVVDVSKGKEWSVGGEALRRYGIDYYSKRRGNK